MSDAETERNKILVKIVETIAALRGITIDETFEKNGLGALITEALMICEDEAGPRPRERLAIGALVRRWRSLDESPGDYSAPKA